jgi:hypothetical protein
MSVSTQGIWTYPNLNQVKTTIADEVAILQSQGKTDGTYVYTDNSPEVGQNTTTRVWDSQQTAEQWLTFIYSLGVDPVSYVILPATPE